MEKTVRIDFSSSIELEGDVQTHQLITKGIMQLSDLEQIEYITFVDESPNDASSHVQSEVAIFLKPDGELLMQRDGDVMMEQAFFEGQIREGIYITPHGKFRTEAQTDQLVVIETPQGLQIILKYLFYIGGIASGNVSIRLVAEEESQ